MEHIVIIGNGISGITAARHIRKLSDKRITVISAESDFFFSRTALMYVYMGHMKFENIQPYENWFWEKNNINLVRGFVSHVDVKDKQLTIDKIHKINYDKLIIATGSKPNKFGWPGQDLDGVMGMYHKQDLENLEKHTHRCESSVIVGGGLIGIELAEMLLSRGKKVTFLVREDSFWNGVLPKEESEMINRHIREHHIDLRLDTNLKEILPDENGQVKAVVTDKDELIPCQVVGLTAGVTPNIDFLKNSGIELGKGVKVNQYLETNIPGVYALGDCAEQLEPVGDRRPVEAVWYTGRMMGETVAQTICGKPTRYNPGHWFNSAKFLDIEYQTYGWVWAHPKANEDQFYWEHSDGKKCVRLVFDKNTREFLGINTFGIRMRHEFFDQALTEKWSVDQVIANLKNANFDPEFFKSYETAIQQEFSANA
ncbi:MAG: FAD-dependent oxidoreductase [Bacteroidetes bacterium HGW-Bacteroidetes-13]|nr:MAG: FAD-dependent oxidoreductase [Bacteroidetes bacterium HGW-Bacteroidetes-13]